MLLAVHTVRGPIGLAPTWPCPGSECPIASQLALAQFAKSGETFPPELLPHFQTHSRSNSVSRSHSRPRAFKLSATFSLAIQFATTCNKVLYLRPAHSLPYLFICFTPSPPPMPIPFPQPVPHLHPAPRRSRTLPNQPHQIVYHTYDAPRGPT